MRRASAWIVVLAALIGLRVLAKPEAATVARSSNTDRPVGSAPSPSPRQALGRLPLIFAEQRGQYCPEVRYRTVLSSQVATLTDEGLVLTRLGRSGSGSDAPLLGHNIRLRFASASTGRTAPARLVAVDPAQTRCSWFPGNDSEHWVTDVPTWATVRYEDVVPGVDIDVHGRSGALEYDVLAAAGADPADLVVVVEGADSVRVADDGSVEIDTPLGTMRQQLPLTWQVLESGERRPLACAARAVAPDRFAFAVAGRDSSAALVIDPQLAYGTFVEGTQSDAGWAIAVDDAGAAYVAGTTYGPDFPVTPGSFDVTPPTDQTDAVVFKLLPDGSALEFSTFLGGSGSPDSPSAIKLDMLGRVLIVGGTGSRDFPTTLGAWSQSLLGMSNAYVTQLNPTGTALLYSTYFGGNGLDGPGDVAIDGVGRAILGGTTSSPNLPVTSNALQRTLVGNSCGYLARFSADGSTVDYCTYIHSDIGAGLYGVAVDPSGNMYVGGSVSSTLGFPVTPGAFQTVHNGWGDAYVLKIAEDGVLSWGTLLGGSDFDRLLGLEVDSAGRVHACGFTHSFNFPTTPGAADLVFNGEKDCWVTELAADGASAVFSTYLGGSDYEDAEEIALDAEGHSYIVSNTSSSNFPVTPDAVDPILNKPGGSDVHVAKLSADGSTLLHGTFIGGSTPTDLELAYGIAVDPQGNPYITGYTLAANFPTTTGAFDTHLDGPNGLFVVKLDLSPWSDDGPGLAGTGSLVPALSGSGTLQPHSPGALQLLDAKPLSPCWLIVGVSKLSAPFKGGTFVPSPLLVVPLATNGQGAATLQWAAWPAGLPAGSKLWFQVWIADPGGPAGYAASNGLRAVMPVVAP